MLPIIPGSKGTVFKCVVDKLTGKGKKVMGNFHPRS